MTGRALPTLLLLALTAIGCDTPSSRVDGGDLHGVFARDGGTSAAGSASAASTASARAPVDAGARLPELRRRPVAGPCAAKRGDESLEPPRPRPGERPARRPACRAARILEWRDPRGNPRYACVTGPRDASERAPLPLMIFFHPDHDTPRSVGRSTKLRRHNDRFDMTGDPQRKGFMVLAPQGRRMHGKNRFATVPPSADNVDVRTVDHFVEVLRGEGLVDPSRVYTVGFGEGAPMAMLYAMIHPDLVAAVGLYAGVPAELEWSCDGTAPPTMVLYRACDARTPCSDVERWLERWRGEGHTAVGMRLATSDSEETHCGLSKKCRGRKGEANHRRWPKGKEPDLLEFLARHRMKERR